MADIKISQLPAASSATNDDVLPVVQAGSTKKVSVNQLKAPILDSPVMTGNPTAPTPAVGDNDTSVATTEFVNAEIANDRPYSSVDPLMDGIASQGTSTKVSREDHKHPTDTSRAPLDSPALTGTPTAPTPGIGASDNQIATTKFVNDEIDHDTDYLRDFRAWDSTRTYAQNDPVFHLGIPYKSLIADNLNNNPASSPDKWEVTGGGSSSVNPGVNFENGQFESSLVGWGRYKNTAQATPIDGNGGTPTIGFFRHTTNPLIGNASALIDKTASNQQGEGVASQFSIGRGLTHETMKIEFKYETDENYADGYVGVFLFDILNNVLIPLSVQDVPASYGKPATFLATFIPSTSTQYRLIFHVATNTTTAWTFKLDDVEVSDKDMAIGAAISEWKSYTPTFSVSPTSSVLGWYRRIGDSVEIHGRVAFGATSGGSIVSISLPNGLSMDVSKVNSTAYNTNLGSFCDMATLESQEPIVTGSGGVYFAATGASLVNRTVVFRFTVPIAQWTSNVNLASDFQEFASNDGSGGTAAGATYNTGMQYGPEGSLIKAVNSSTGGGSETKYKVSFQTPIQDTDRISIEIKAVDSTKWQPLEAGIRYVVPYVTTPNNYGLGWMPLDNNSIYVIFGNAGRIFASTAGGYGGVGMSWSDISSYRWRVRKISNGNMAEQPTQILINKNTDTPVWAERGAGIIESGFVSGRGWYVKYGDGTMEQRKRQAWALVATSQPTTRMAAWMLPMPFIDTDFVIVATATDPGGESWGDVGAIARNGLLATNAAVNQANLSFYPYQQATSQTVRYDGYVKGRWKA